MDKFALTGKLTYNGNVEHLLGDVVYAPRLGQELTDISIVRWVVTDVAYDPDTNKTYVELDGEYLESEESE